MNKHFLTPDFYVIPVHQFFQAAADILPQSAVFKIPASTRNEILL